MWLALQAATQRFGMTSVVRTFVVLGALSLLLVGFYIVIPMAKWSVKNPQPLISPLWDRAWPHSGHQQNTLSVNNASTYSASATTTAATTTQTDASSATTAATLTTALNVALPASSEKKKIVSPTLIPTTVVLGSRLEKEPWLINSQRLPPPPPPPQAVAAVATTAGEKRARDLQKMCPELKKTDLFNVTSSYEALKVGCSFWKRVFVLLKEQPPQQQHQQQQQHHQQQQQQQQQQQHRASVFDMSGVKVHHSDPELRKVNGLLWKTHPDFFRTARKFLFVRDPYERLFSGFIDKLFTPTFETDTIAREVLTIKRLSATTQSSTKVDVFPPSVPLTDGLDNSDTALVKVNFRTSSGAERNKSETGTYPFQRGFEKRHSDMDKMREGLHDGGDGNLRGTERIPRGVDSNIPPRRGSDVAFTRSTILNGETRESQRNSKPEPIPDRSQFLSTSSTPRGHRFLSQRFFRQDSCQMSVTFADFVRYVTSSVANVNNHFHPMSETCPPCMLKYDFVGKMETFRQDADDILTSAGVDPLLFLSSDSTFDQDSDLSILRDVTLRTFSVIYKYRRCITPAETLLRTWTTFQIRGYLSINQSFPLTEEAASRATREQFLKIVIQAYNHSGPREVRMRQRKAAMLEAFHGLPRSLLEKLEAYVSKDCQFFGYECSVEKRFNSKDAPEPTFHLDKAAGKHVPFETGISA